jgi:Ras-related GTP-binding protein C/D
MQSYELCSDMIDVVLDFTSIYGNQGDTFKTDDESYSVIRLTNGVLYMRTVNSNLVLVCLIREDLFDKQGLIDYNSKTLAKAIKDVLGV